MTPAADRNILLAFDFGHRRIGVATGNLLTGTATPLGTMASADGLPWHLLDRSIEEWRPGTLLVGIPGGAGVGRVTAKRDTGDEATDTYASTEVAADQHAPAGVAVSPCDTGDVAAAAHTFASALKRRYGLPVATTDERLTSRAAKSRLREARASGRMTRRVNKGDIDSHAACIIAEQWLSRQA